jgi:hypothetical protein
MHHDSSQMTSRSSVRFPQRSYQYIGAILRSCKEASSSSFARFQTHLLQEKRIVWLFAKILVVKRPVFPSRAPRNTLMYRTNACDTASHHYEEPQILLHAQLGYLSRLHCSGIRAFRWPILMSPGTCPTCGRSSPIADSEWNVMESLEMTEGKY